MNLSHLGQILWSHRLVIITPTICSLLGGLFVMLTFPPRYQATSRIMLDIIKPDPITGFRVSTKGYDAYVASQVQIIRDEQVGGRVVESMGWLESPDMLAAWQAAPDKGDDFRRWAARRITFGTGVDLVPETNILEIKFQSTAPDLARVIADNIRTAYVETSVTQQRESARGTSVGYAAQAAREQERLLQLQTIKANLERETGILMQAEAADVDTERLVGMATSVRAASTPVAPVVVDRSASIRAQMAQLDGAIAEATKTLGPNNPTLLRMKQQRELMNIQATAFAPQTPTGDFVMRQAEASAGIMRQQIQKVLTQSDKVLALHLVTDEIKRRRKLLSHAAEKSGSMRQLSNISDANLTPIGLTTVDPAPVFPNIPLILGGSGGLGLLGGLLLSFLIEALERRVRSVSDLRSAAQAPSIVVIPHFHFPKGRPVRVKRLRPPKAARREKPVREPKRPKPPREAGGFRPKFGRARA